MLNVTLEGRTVELEFPQAAIDAVLEEMRSR